MINDTVTTNTNQTPRKDSAGAAIKRAEDRGFRVEVQHNRLNNADFRDIQRVVHLIEKSGGTVTKAVERDILSNYTYSDGPPSDYAPRGGKTLVKIFLNGENVGWFGESICSIADNFNRRDGVRKALRRALREAAAAKAAVK